MGVKMGVISLPLTLYLLLSILGQCEMSIYPGLRRKPLSQTLQQQAYEISDTDFLSQLMEENARRRLQQQFEQQLELINRQLDRQRQREKEMRRRERERERYKQNQLHMQHIRQKQQQQQQPHVHRELMNEADWRALKQVGNSDSMEYATSYSYNKNKHNNNRPYVNYEQQQQKLAKNQRIPFAVAPSDPRFYEGEQPTNSDEEEEEQSAENDLADEHVVVVNDNDSIETADDIDLRTLDDYEEYVPDKSSAVNLKTVQTAAPSFPVGATIVVPTQASAATFHRIKPASAMAAAAVVAGVKPPSVMRNDINALIDKLQKEGGLPKEQQVEPHLVVRHYLGMTDNDWGIYAVALIAGLSAALTVGLIAFGLAWMHNKSKAAADVEYPAYGVTGPNRDVSPSGDRKLAQSAQMYHYQHQKQQIMAMENRPVEAGLSDVDSDDDNEEGDYTVYECPGLAPTGEMEVKNPLFMDDTPVVTPSTGANTVATTTTTPAVNAKTTQVSLKHKKEASTQNEAKTQNESKKKNKK